MHKNYDQLLNIETDKLPPQASERLEAYSPYEATPYPILHTLFKVYQLHKKDVFVDFGCGMGRLLFLVHHLFGSSVVGLELDELLYEKTIQNKQSYIKQTQSEPEEIKVIHLAAERYSLQHNENKFYFFNPFSIDILEKVIENIMRSYEKNKRTIDLIFYYPWDAYVQYISAHTPFTLCKEVKIPDLYERNRRERFLIYRL